MSARAMGSHHAPNRGATNEWLTPPFILDALGPFDLDPCAPINRPWATAERHYTIEDDGLSQPWEGAVWCNPPYGPDVWVWLARLADHGNGIALIFARTETAGFVREVWGKATALLFLHGRLFFHYPDGRAALANSGAPSVLVAYGATAARRLAASTLAGTFVPLGTERTGWLIVYDDGERAHTDDAGLTAALHAAGGRLARVVNLDRVWAT